MCSIGLPLQNNIQRMQFLKIPEPLCIKLGSKLGTVLDRELRTVVDIKFGSKLGILVDSERCTGVVLDIELGSKLGTVLDRKLCTVL